MTYPIAGVLLGVLGLALATRRGWLTRPGVGAGLVVGAALVTGTHSAGPILLVVFLASSSGLSRLRIDGPRTAWQVLANSAVPGIAALLAAFGVFPCAGTAVALIASYLPAAAWGPTLPSEFTPALMGELVGLFADSFIGAAVEGRIPGINNETVNLIGSLAGAVTACLLA